MNSFAVAHKCAPMKTQFSVQCFGSSQTLHEEKEKKKNPESASCKEKKIDLRSWA